MPSEQASSRAQLECNEVVDADPEPRVAQSKR